MTWEIELIKGADYRIRSDVPVFNVKVEGIVEGPPGPAMKAVQANQYLRIHQRAMGRTFTVSWTASPDRDGRRQAQELELPDD
ncbi:hypothetical protein AB0I28_35550 [Phytomonospora sp. NPDC050363]|uniref:hypothetical protein n=1 Tax=Phytomonospora sp. NPDC050363 TaxID=3155642 RepID=UPI0033E4A6FD